MITRFDAFDRYEVPEVSLCSPGSIIRYENSNPYPTKVFGALRELHSFHMEPHFNAPWEISFSIDETTETKSVFDRVATKMALYLEEYGYFIIDSCSETKDYREHTVSKSITASSAESEIYQYECPHIEDGMYSFAGTPTEKSILGLCATVSPKWKFKMENIEESLRDVEHYFSDVDHSNLYDFLIKSLQDRYDCLFEFDIINREVHSVSKAYYVQTHETDIHLSKVNVLSKMEKSSSNEDIYTALKVSGGKDLEILYVNPIGTNMIYDFTYRLGLMSDELQTAVKKWDAQVKASQAPYLTLSKQYCDQMDALGHLNAEVGAAKEVLDGAQKTMDDLIEKNASKVELAAQKKTIADLQKAVYDAQTAYDNQKVSVDALHNQMVAINQKCSLSVTAKDVNGNAIFTDELLEELSSYIYPGEYSDEDIIQTDAMTYAQILEQQKLLMAEAETQMKKVSTENFKFTVDTDDFLFNKMFSPFSEQLEPGSIIYVESDDDVFEQYHVSSIDIDFDDKKCSLVFSNKYNKYDIQSLFDDVMGSVSKSASSIKRILSIIEDQERKLNASTEWIDKAMKLTASHVLASEQQNVVISDTGYWGRRVQTDANGNTKTDALGNILYEPEQIKIINNGLYITSDNWDTVETAIGKLVIGKDQNGKDICKFGVLADVIIGKLLLGSQLYIEAQNKDGVVSTRINENGVSVYNGGITIYSNQYGAPDKKALYMTSDGNLVLNNIDAQSGKIAGWMVDNIFLYNHPNGGYGSGMAAYPVTDLRVAFWAGYSGSYPTPSGDGTWQNHTNFYVLNDGRLHATNADITGKITATSGKIGGWTLGQTYIGSNNDTGAFYIASANDAIEYWIRAVYNGSTRFSVSRDGILTATGANISGEIYATSGTIGGCTIKNGVLQIANANIGDLNVSKLSGGTNNNNISLTNATVKGTIKADAGYFGKWDIEGGYFKTDYIDNDTGLPYTLYLTNWGINILGGGQPRKVSWVAIIDHIT